MGFTQRRMSIEHMKPMFGFCVLALLMSVSVSACQKRFLSDLDNTQEVENADAFWVVPFEQTAKNRMVILVNLEQFWVPNVSTQELTDTVASNIIISIDGIRIEPVSISYFHVFGGAATDEDGEIIGRYGAPLEVAFSIQNLTGGPHQVTIKTQGPSGVYQYYRWGLECDDTCILTDS
jgi:hypothetical protein